MRISSKRRLEKSLSDQLESLKQEKELFSHLVNNLMEKCSTIQGALKLPELRFETQAAKQIKDFLDETCTQTKNTLYAMTLIQNKNENNENCDRKKPVLLMPFFSECVNYIKNEASKKNILLTVTPGISTDTVVYTDTAILDLIFKNLFSSAVNLSPKNSRITIWLNSEADWVTCSVQNKISRDFLDLVKENNKNFISQSVKHEIFFLKKLLEFYNGSFSIEKAPPSYFFKIKMNLSIFSATEKEISLTDPLDVPVYKKELDFLPPSLPKDSLFPCTGNPPLILLVEENAQNTFFISSVLNKHCDIINTASGAEAWNYLNDHTNRKPDIVISEYYMSELRGSELYSKCAGETYLADIPFLILLQTFDADKTIELLRKGVTACLVKPFSSRELFCKLYSIFSTKLKITNSILAQIKRAVTTEEVQNKIEDNKSTKSLAVISLTAAQNSVFNSAGLSAREQQIALLISTGKSDKDIAEQLRISPATVASHNKKIFKKLNVHSRLELINKVR